MSAKVLALVWDYYNPERCGAPLILAVSLADEADDGGGGIFQSSETLARKTRQNERSIRRQLRQMEASGVLVCVQRSAGGAGNFSQYRLDLSALIVLKNPDPMPGITRTVCPGYSEPNPDHMPGLSDPLYIGLKEKNVTDPTTRTSTHLQGEDERLAKWMLGKIRELNPKHRDPSWRTWLTDLRLLRERDLRSHREIAALFAWANADPFWRLNILSPAKLRKQWDALELKRQANGGAGAGHVSVKEDRSCVGTVDGALCGKPGAFKCPDGKWRCRAHREQQSPERQAA